MKREGRQHGMVRSYRVMSLPWNANPNSRIVNKLDAPPAAGFYAKVLSKPTNHSKFTGKCGRPRCEGCHIHPACKSRDKTKGTHKLRSSDILLNHRLMAWKVIDKGYGSNYAGISATGILGHLSGDRWDDEVEDDVDDGYDDSSENGLVADSRYVDEEEEIGPSGLVVESRYVDGEEEIEPGGIEIGAREEEEDDDDDNNEDDCMSFCDVGFVFEQEDEGWCLVGEM